MSDEFSDLDEMLGFLSEEGSAPDGGEHLEPALLAAYQAHELSPEDDLKVRTHLATCKHCRELLLDLEEMLAPSPSAATADLNTKAGWRKLQEELKRSAESQTPKRPARRRFVASVWGGYIVAAALLVAVIELGLRNGELARNLKEPKPLPTTKSFSARGSSRGETDGIVEPIALPAHVILILPTDKPAPLYRVVMYGQKRGEVNWSLDLPAQDGELSFSLPDQSLSPGLHILHVAAHDGERPASPPWEYRLLVGPPAK